MGAVLGVFRSVSLRVWTWGIEVCVSGDVDLEVFRSVSLGV